MLRIALRHAGFKVRGKLGHYPLLVVDAEPGRRRRRRYAVYLLTGEPALTGPGPERMIRFRRGVDSWDPPPPETTPLVVAYSSRHRVFVAFQGGGRAEEERLESLPPVSDRWLRRARRAGLLQDAPDGSGVVAFTADRLRGALALVGVRAHSISSGVGLEEIQFELEKPKRRQARIEKRERRVVLDKPALARRPAFRRAFGGPAFPKPVHPRGPVETGFSMPGAPTRNLTRITPLKPGATYLFWLSVGANSGSSIEEEDVALPEELPTGARLTVRVATFEGEIELDGPAQGEIRVTEAGARVAKPAAKVEGALRSEDARLFFRVRAPDRPGVHGLRCSIYYGSTLVQSRLVRARVGPGTGKALSSRLDYRLTGRLSPTGLAQVPSHDLSILVNGDERSHQFHFFRAGDREPAFGESSSLSAENLDTTIKQSREALREVAWGSPAEWDGNVNSYRYQRAPQPAQFVEDLAKLAQTGAALYTEIADQIAGGIDRRDELETISGSPGRVQIAAPSSLYVPVGLFYDHPIHDVSSKGERFTLCPDFSAASAKGEPLEQSACMTAGCRYRDEEAVICPSGFWGFRHELGWPPSGDLPASEISHLGDPSVVIGVSTDRKLKLRGRHVSAIKRDLGRASSDLEVVESLEDLTQALKRRSLNLVYMYCHGGMSGHIPYVELGRPGSTGLTRNYLRTNRPWAPPPPRSVVFVNGCHTTKVGPSQVLSLVSGFVKEAGAAGVIGTELTVFEPLACAFAEQMLPGFLDGERTIGGAVRHARLELLRARNPLGLVYVPFIAAGTRLVKQP